MDTLLLHAVASPRRREILRLLATSEQSAGDIHRAMSDVSFGAVSLQLKVLLHAGLVERRAEGTQRIYTIRQQAFAPVADMLQKMWSDALHRLKLQAELAHTRRGPRPARKTTRARSGRARKKDKG